ETTTSINDFCADKSLKPDLIKLDVEGAEVRILPSISDSILKNITLYLEFHVPQIKNDFGEDPLELLDFLFKKFRSIEFNRNHWGDFKGVPTGKWEKLPQKEIEDVIVQILNGESKPRGFGLILSNR
ncbi:MAG: hypothetical protein CMF52_04620, partial [Legionellales bacterium]|nr:hypothetical protein [Legionellales bacterium]